MKTLIVFDLDGTLAESKSSVDDEMSGLMRDLLAIAKVAVISGGDWPQFESQLIANLPFDARLRDLSLLPTCGTKFYRFGSSWEQLYSEDFSDREKETIVDSLQRALRQSDLSVERVWGEQIEDRGSQVTLSALGQQAPLDMKKAWDPDFAKRKAMKAFLETVIPEFSIRLGGTTSVDVTKPGIDKAYAIRKLRDILEVAIDEMIFVGDALFPGGNDYPVKQAGVTCIQVRDPDETKRVIEAVIACLASEQPARPSEMDR